MMHVPTQMLKPRNAAERPPVCPRCQAPGRSPDTHTPCAKSYREPLPTRFFRLLWRGGGAGPWSHHIQPLPGGLRAIVPAPRGIRAVGDGIVGDLALGRAGELRPLELEE